MIVKRVGDMVVRLMDFITGDFLWKNYRALLVEF